MTVLCKYPGCDMPKGKALGWCNAHYTRNAKGRDMAPPVRKHNATDEERFWSKVDKAGTCWIWTAALQNTGGYGVFRINSRNMVAHRVSYMWAHGPIPKGYEVDHTCFNRSCVKPDHLRLLTHQENGQNRAGANINSRSGVRGVYWSQNQWIARACIGPVTHEVGRFDNLADAEKAMIAWRHQHMPVSLRDRRKAA
ncbi:HNH endonuclease signature motif containing protein [Microbacterium esteraromaticum]|nr:HNH endonuclease signature motif containing protein [Microbacterium esteraromaticum]